MLFSSATLSSPLSLYSIPVVYFTAFYPNFLKFLTIDKTIGYNNVQPRSNTAKFLENKNISPKLAAKIQRMEGAHLNGNETFPLWSAAIVSSCLEIGAYACMAWIIYPRLYPKIAANIAGLDNAFMNKTALAYITGRILFNQVYINHESPNVSWLRTAIFFASNSMSIMLLIKAAQKMAASH